MAIPTIFAETGVLGQHTVRRGETLFCVGRTYRVDPRAIAEANNLRSPYRLSVGQVLVIPAVRWERVPGGPTCVAQFSSPYVTGSPAVVTTPSPATDASGVLRHVVRKGETVYCIGRAYRVVPNAILRANGLTANRRIYPGMVLIIPNVPWTNIPAGPVCGAQADAFAVREAAVAATPTPTCEEGSFFDTVMNLCRRPDEPPTSLPTPTIGYPE
ncbi:MAG: LysM domain-containing protein [Anaerolineales bacterium]|nr:LysM domain-containing protein [Anaerolineales bacterium]